MGLHLVGSWEFDNAKNEYVLALGTDDRLFAYPSTILGKLVYTLVRESGPQYALVRFEPISEWLSVDGDPQSILESEPFMKAPGLDPGTKKNLESLLKNLKER